MKHCPYCLLDFDASRLRDPETCPECGGELKPGATNCNHRHSDGQTAMVQASNGFMGEMTWRCSICGEEL